MSTALRRVVRHIEERLESIKDATESVKPSSLLEVRLYLVDVIS
jgi:hypothetical protein